MGAVCAQAYLMLIFLILRWILGLPRLDGLRPIPDRSYD